MFIKTPSNAYRIPFFRALFKTQTLKILHLKRDAQSSINGLLDGWRYNRGFHAHFINGFILNDEPTVPNGTWKYDLPPNFGSQLDLPLPQICAFQWNSAHKYILENRQTYRHHLINRRFKINFNEGKNFMRILIRIIT